jgi:hypothetical protein
MQAYLFYKPKILEVGELKSAFEQAVSAVLGANAEIRVAHPRRDTGREGVVDSIMLGTESLRAVVDLSKIEFRLTAGSYPDGVYVGCRTMHGLFWESIYLPDHDSKRKVEPVTGQHGDYIVVPRNPTKGMLDAAWADALAEDAAGVWLSMIEAYEESSGNSDSGNG